MSSFSEGRYRLVAATGVVAAHLLLVFAATRHRIVPPVAAVVAMTVVAVPAPGTAPPTDHDPALAVDLAPPEITTAASVAASPVACDLPDVVGRALQADAAIAPELARAASGPPTPMMLWNGSWSTEPGTAPLRQAVGGVLATARADCLDEVLTGPRLIFLRAGETTVSIAVGSGTWRWRELLA